jgi:ribose transport system substrate-binding protein
LSHPAPAGKTIDYITCSITNCTEFARAFHDVANMLGWKFNLTQTEVTPAALNAALDQDIQGHPDGIIINGLVPRSAMAESLAKLEASGIPWATTGTDSSWGEPTGNYIGADFTPIQAVEPQKIAAAWAISDSGGKAHIAFFNDPSIGEIQSGEQAFLSTIADMCSGCVVYKSTMSIGGIGTSFPGQVVSFLESHPDVNYVWPPFGGSELGLPSALAAAGLAGKVKILSWDAASNTIQATQSGQEAMSTFEQNTDGAYRVMDLFARKFVGDSLSCCQAIDESLPVQIATKQTISQLPWPATEPWHTIGVQQAFAKAWGLTQS